MVVAERPAGPRWLGFALWVGTVADVLNGLAMQVFQQQRAFAEKAVAVEFDWDAFGSVIHSDEGKRELQTLRSTYLDIKQRLANLAKVGAALGTQHWAGGSSRGAAQHRFLPFSLACPYLTPVVFLGAAAPGAH